MTPVLEPLLTTKADPAEQPAKSSPAAHATRRKLTARFWGSAAILVVILIGYNLILHRLAANTQRHQMLSRLEQIPADTDILFVGNSLVEAGCNVEAFQAAWPAAGFKPKAVNLALGATSPVEHDLILRHAVSRKLAAKYIVYGFFDDQLYSFSAGNWEDLVGNRAFSYYFPDQAAELYAPGSPWKKWELRIVGHIPMLAERSSLWTKVELLRRQIEEIGMEKKKTNRFGRVDDFAGLEPRDIKDFNGRCDLVVEKRAGFSAPIRDIIAAAKAQQARLIFLGMPMPFRHREVFYGTPSWQRLQAYLKNSLESENISYLDASDWIKTDDKFEDATHLNEEGAKIFSAQLAGAISHIPDPNSPQDFQLPRRIGPR